MIYEQANNLGHMKLNNDSWNNRDKDHNPSRIGQIKIITSVHHKRYDMIWYT